MKKILVLGIGNILLKDEGVGVLALRFLEENYTFSEQVTLFDGGTRGMKLLPLLENADTLIVLDAVELGEVAGCVKILTYSQLKTGVVAKNSLHQVNFRETLLYAELLDCLPESTVIVAVQPEDMTPWGISLTRSLRAAFPSLCTQALAEIRAAGAEFTPRKKQASIEEILQSIVTLEGIN